MTKEQKEVVSAQLKNEKDCLDALKETYKDALADIDERIAMLLGRDDADMQNVVYQVQYQKALRNQIATSLDALRDKNFETVSDYLTRSYEEGFLGSLYDMQKQGVPLIFPMDQAQVVEAITKDTKLSEGLYSALGKNVESLKKTISAEISRGISTGMTYGQIAGNVGRYADIDMGKAFRIARTEGHRISSKASFDACEKAKDNGADVVKQWDATLDSKTRDSHRQVDGEIRELNEPFSNGLMYPSDPSGDAEETINCRCVLLQRARWNVDTEFTKMVRDDDGTHVVSFKSAKDYDEFKKAYWGEIEKVGKAKEEVFAPAKKYSDLQSQRIRLQGEIEETERQKAEAELEAIYSPSQEVWDKAQLLSEQAKTLHEELGSVMEAIVEMQGERAKEVEKELVDKGICKSVRFSKQMSIDAMEETKKALETLAEKGFPTVDSVVYDPSSCGLRGCVAYYDNQTNSIHLSKSFKMTTEEYMRARSDAETVYVQYRAQKNLEEVSKSLMQKALEDMESAPDKARLHFARQNYQTAEIIGSESRKAVSESLYDVIVHEYGHSVQFRLTSTQDLYKATPSFYGKDILKSKGESWNPNNLDGKVLASKVSLYATESPLECFAESFVAYEKGVEIPEELREMIERAISEIGKAT